LQVDLVYGVRTIPVAAALNAEILLLRHQLNVLRRRSLKRVALSNIDRLVFAGLYCLAHQVLDALKILKPETVSDRVGAGGDRIVHVLLRLVNQIAWGVHSADHNARTREHLRPNTRTDCRSNHVDTHEIIISNQSAHRTVERRQDI
jgi:hypothetical protein